MKIIQSYDQIRRVVHHDVILDGSLFSVITGCGDGIARMFDAKSGALKRSMKGHESTINTLQV